MQTKYSFIKLLILIPVIIQSCNNDTTHLFTLLSTEKTGIEFKNLLREDENANVLNYAYFYNGGGVAVGDINNDGLPDILFTGNMVPNRLYLNEGNFKFKDITEKSGISKFQGWCAGATMVDINGDGLLDIYICRSGDINPSRRKNLLFINNGNLTFTEEADKYGLSDKGYSTQAAFFDYDKDSDLDMILINHSLQKYASKYEDSALRNEYNPDFAVKLYRNDNGYFIDVSKQSGITSNLLTFGLGLSISDINNDGWPDVYVSNDFNESDYLFMNNQNGTFTEKIEKSLDECSLYSMGCDCADFNNDGNIDIMTLDMLPEGNHAQKMHNGPENFDKFQTMFHNGTYYQYSRNMLHLNNGDGTFSEIGQLAGVSNTDWSWAPLFCDFDNDGNKDIFITNGYGKDFTDMDFIKHNVDRTVRERQGGSIEDIKNVLARIPSVKIPNYIFRNNGDNTFINKIADWGLNQNNISSGAVYADLNNDGNMDLIISNINETASIYENNTGKLFPGNNYLKIKLQGNSKNSVGLGAKIKLYCGNQLYYQEQFPVRGFQSSVDQILNFGIGKHTLIDSVIVEWPDDKMQKLHSIKINELLTLKWSEANLQLKYDSVKGEKYFTPVTAINFKHEENEFNDFAVQSLLPNYLSRQGPCMAKADINNDRLEDIFIGGAKGHPSAIFIQNGKGDFIEKQESDLEADSICEDVSATFFDADNDGDMDLYVGSGGYEFAENDPALQDRLYVNDGKGHFIKNVKALPSMLISTGVVKVADINGNGYMDLFVGGRMVPGKYPEMPESKILLNDGKGHFTDATQSIAPALQHIGMVTDALWLDVNGDDRKDLIVVGEWMPIKVFMNQNGKLIDASAQYIKFPSTGWWNTIAAADFDGDGDCDLIIGNCGLNTQFKASEKEPLTIYYKDFDDNGSIDPILSYFIHDGSYPVASMDDIVYQLPMLKKKFFEYHTYADATIDDIFLPEQLKNAGLLKASNMQTVYLENKGKDGFVLKQLPAEAEYSPVYSIAVADVNHDGKTDMILGGNNAWTRIKFGRFMANHGILLLGDGKGNFTYVPQWKSGLNIRGDIRSMQVIYSANKTHLFFGLNDNLVKTFINSNP